MIYCPDCGSELLFDSASQMMVCGYCKNRFDPYKLKDNLSNDAKTQVFFDSYAYICPSCGAEIDTADKNDAVGFCPYCKGSSMIFDKLRRDWTPEGIVPFMITKEQCKQLYCAQVKKYFFVSGKFRNPDLIEEFRGIYMPYWFYNFSQKGIITVSGTKEHRSGNYRIVDYAFNLPWTIKALNGREKGIVREAFRGLLPDAIIDRKKSPYPKTHHPLYFELCAAEVTRILEDKTSPLRDILDKSGVEAIIQQPDRIASPWYGQLMRAPQILAYIIQLDHWFRRRQVTILS